MKVYVVTEGEYSDYRVNSIFSTIEKALEYSKMFGMNDPIELELDEQNCLLEKYSGLIFYSVNIEINGNSLSVYPTTLNSNRPPRVFKNEYSPDILNVHCWAKDEKHAVKIANEKRIQLIANNQWEESPKKERDPRGFSFTHYCSSSAFTPMVEAPKEDPNEQA